MHIGGVAASDPTRAFEDFRDRGDPAALASVFDGVAPRLLLLGLHLTRNRADAEDLVQETFLTALRDAEGFDGRTGVERWLSGILAHRAQDLLRRRARSPDPRRLASAVVLNPADAAIDADALEQVDRALERMPDAYRQVLVLRLHHGLTGKAIARALGRSVDTVHTQIRRGLEALRGQLPVGLAVALARLDDVGRGLGAVRDEVLRRAVVPAAGTGMATGLVVGGWVVKKVVAAVVLVCLVAAAWVWLGRETEQPRVPGTGGTADPVVVANGVGAVSREPDPGRRELVATPAEETSSSRGSDKPSTATVIAGVVVDAAGEPVPQATVTAWQVLSEQERVGVGHVRCDAAGRFEIVCPDRMDALGQVRLAAGDDPNAATLDARSFTWGEQDVRLEVVRAAEVTFEVVAAESGEPLARFRYRLRARAGHYGSGGKATEDRLTRMLVPDSYDLWFHADDSTLRAGRWMRIELELAGPHTVRVPLELLGPRDVRVVTTDGRPVPAARVRVVRASSSELRPDSRIADRSKRPELEALSFDVLPDGYVITDAVTDAAGIAQLGVPVDCTGLWLDVRGAHRARILPLPASSEAGPIVIVVDEGRVFAGRVEPADAAARFGGELALRIGLPGGRRTVGVEESGRFEVHDAAPGAYEVHAVVRWTTVENTMHSRLRVPEPLLLPADDGEMVVLDLHAVLAVHEPASLEVRVLRDQRIPAGARLVLRALRDVEGRDRDGLYAFGPVTLDRSDHARFVGVRPGRYRLALFGESTRIWSEEVFEIPSGGRIIADAEFIARTLRARIVDAEGLPLRAGERFELTSDTDPRSFQGTTDVDGVLRVEHLALGQWSVHWLSATGTEDVGDILITRPETELELRLR